MPEGYTHLRCAWRAARAQKLTADLHREAFFAGANGPDMLFCYQVWKSAKKRAYPLPDLGERMHNENTGAFLRALLDGAKTPVQRSYAAGFLCHYAADTVVHPYVVLVTSPGQAYEGPGGHGYFEIALDSRLHESDTGDAAVPVAHCCPRMDDAALDEVIPLLAGAIEAAYGERYPEPALRDAFAQATFIRSLFICRGPVKRGLLRLAEPLFGKPGTVMGHVTPARLRPGLPETWAHPFTGEEFTGGIPALLERAEQRCGLYLAAGRAYWAGSMTMQELSALLGSRSYLSGTEDAASTGEAMD